MNKLKSIKIILPLLIAIPLLGLLYNFFSGYRIGLCGTTYSVDRIKINGIDVIRRLKETQGEGIINCASILSDIRLAVAVDHLEGTSVYDLSFYDKNKSRTSDNMISRFHLDTNNNGIYEFSDFDGSLIFIGSLKKYPQGTVVHCGKEYAIDPIIIEGLDVTEKINDLSARRYLGCQGPIGPNTLPIKVAIKSDLSHGIYDVVLYQEYGHQLTQNPYAYSPDQYRIYIKKKEIYELSIDDGSQKFAAFFK